jgi:hypothetical protein
MILENRAVPIVWNKLPIRTAIVPLSRLMMFLVGDITAFVICATSRSRFEKKGAPLAVLSPSRNCIESSVKQWR